MCEPDHVGDDRRWGLLEDSRRPLLDTLASVGVVRVEFVGAFPELDMLGVWLGTLTDHERDAADRNSLTDQVRHVLLSVGFTDAELADLHVVPESQETVDRDYAGSWYYAMR
jgi:hypothetical protein